MEGIERISPWLVDVKVVMEVLIVAVMHVTLVELLTSPFLEIRPSLMIISMVTEIT